MKRGCVLGFEVTSSILLNDIQASLYVYIEYTMNLELSQLSSVPERSMTALNQTLNKEQQRRCKKGKIAQGEVLREHEWVR